MRVLVCGGRDYRNAALVYDVLDDLAGADAYNAADGDFILIHGNCPTGADALAESWARDRGVQTVVYPAAWRKLGRSAGPARNQRMIDEQHIDLVVAFPGGRGTADMVRRARKAGVAVRERWGVD